MAPTFTPRRMEGKLLWFACSICTLTRDSSGMPTLETHPLNPYSKDPWNLNNIPILPESLLQFNKFNISGMTVPWTYIGIVFSPLFVSITKVTTHTASTIVRVCLPVFLSESWFTEIALWCTRKRLRRGIAFPDQTLPSLKQSYGIRCLISLRPSLIFFSSLWR